MNLNMNSPLCTSNLCLKNRVIIPPMASQTANEQGFVTAKTLAHYQRLSQSTTSLLMVEYTFVAEDGRSEPYQLGISSKQHIEGLKLLNEVIQKSGQKSALQLVHAGAKTTRSLTGGPLISPSAIPVPVKDREMEKPDPASLRDIRRLQDSFVLAADRAVQAGFDMIEIHAAHGYGLNQWISPITNQRSDIYGGNNPNRFRILLEIVQMIREQQPRLKISVRMPGMDHLIGGMSIQDGIELAQSLENSGVHVLNISSGLGGWRRPRERDGEGYLVNDAEEIQQAVSIPVIGVGGIKTASYINTKISSQGVSLLAVGRSILENENWGQQIGLKR